MRSGALPCPINLGTAFRDDNPSYQGRLIIHDHQGCDDPDTYKTLACWDLEASKKQNLDRLRQENFIGAASAAWLRDVAKVLNRRLDPAGRDRALVTLARGGCPIDEWRPILLWHVTRDEFLVRDFLVNWLFGAYEDGAFRLRPDDLHDYLRTLSLRGGQTEHAWTNATLARVAAGLRRSPSTSGS